MFKSISNIGVIAIIFTALFCQPLLAQIENPIPAQANGDSNVIWIDVRTAEEYAQGFYKDAINIPYDIIANHIAGITEDKTADIRVYCRSGRRSGVAKDILTQMGYTNVVNEGGYQDLLSR